METKDLAELISTFIKPLRPDCGGAIFHFPSHV